MSTDVTEKHVELSATVAAQAKELEFTTANADRLTEKVEELNTALAEAGDKLTDSEEKRAEMGVEFDNAKTQIEELMASVEKVEAEKVEADAKATDLQAKLEDIEAKKIVATRIVSLVEAGMDKTEAETKIEALGDMSDAQFEIVVDMAKASKPEEKDEVEKVTENLEEAEATAEANVNVDDTEDTSEVDDPAELNAAIAERLGLTQKENEE